MGAQKYYYAVINVYVCGMVCVCLGNRKREREVIYYESLIIELETSFFTWFLPIGILAIGCTNECISTFK